MCPVEDNPLRADSMKYLVPYLQSHLQGIGILLQINVVAAVSRLEDALWPQSPNQMNAPRGIRRSPEVLNRGGLRKPGIVQ